MSESTITVESIEALAAQLIAEGAAARQWLIRLIVAEARILGVREPEKFSRMATAYRDEAGHYDNSYPPKQEYCDRTGPNLVKVLRRVTEDVQMSGGFYYDWQRVTTFGGLFVSGAGEIYTSDMTGTGGVGQFAAHPGDTGVECEISWDRADTDEYTLDQLQQAEATLRDLAFPLSAAA